MYVVRPGRFSAQRDMRRMLFRDGGGGDVRDPIRDCIGGGGGTLAVMLTEWSGGGAAGPDLEERLARELRGRLPHAGASVAVWDPTRIGGLPGAAHAPGRRRELRAHKRPVHACRVVAARRHVPHVQAGQGGE